MDMPSLRFGQDSSRRILANKLEVLKLAASQPKETLQEALMVAKKLQSELEIDLRSCSQHDVLIAQKLQHMYISCIEIVLMLLKVLDSQGSVMIGAGAFLPNSKLYSIEKWVSQRFSKYPRGTPFVWGSPIALVAPEVLTRSKLYIDAHHTLIRIEYNSALTKKARKNGARSVVIVLKGLVDPQATHHAAAIRSALQLRSDPRDCFFCFAQEEPICDACSAKVELDRYAIVCKKIGNSLLDQLLRSKADKTAQQFEGSKQASASNQQREIKSAQLETMRGHLEALRKHNIAKRQKIEQMKAQLAQIREITSAGRNFETAQSELERLQSRYDPLKRHLALKQQQLNQRYHDCLLDLHSLHWIESHDISNPYKIPGHPRVLLPRSPSRSNSATIIPLSASTAPGHIPNQPPTPSVPAPSKSNQPKPTWHFLHQALNIEGTLLKTIPLPTTTFIPTLHFMVTIAKWWCIALPYPIEPFPVPKIQSSSLINHHPASGFTPLNDGWHIIPLVSANSASEYEATIHQLIADDARAIIRAIKTFPDDAVDWGDFWLNSFCFTFSLTYVHAFHNAKLTTTSASGGDSSLSSSSLSSSGTSISENWTTVPSSPTPAPLSSSSLAGSITSIDIPEPRGITKRGRAHSRIVVSQFPGDDSLTTSSSSGYLPTPPPSSTPNPIGASISAVSSPIPTMGPTSCPPTPPVPAHLLDASSPRPTSPPPLSSPSISAPSSPTPEVPEYATIPIPPFSDSGWISFLR